MILLLIILAIAAAVGYATLRVVRNDGRGRQRPPRSHFDDPQFHAPRPV